jgi:hypothetical protein
VFQRDASIYEMASRRVLIVGEARTWNLELVAETIDLTFDL